MHASVFDAEQLTNHVNSYFRELQVNGKLDGKISSKPTQFPKRPGVYKGALHLLDTDVFKFTESLQLDVPCFLVEAASVIQQNAHTEGIFRKSGSTSRKSLVKTRLNKGGTLIDFDANMFIHDIAAVLLQFIRDLPQPLLHGSYQDVLLGCLCKPALKKDVSLQEEAILIACLPLPRIYLNTLTFFIRLLSYIASKEEVNRMTAKTLATCTAQSIMVPPAHLVGDKDRIDGNIRVVEILIKNAERIGFVPPRLLDKMRTSSFTTLTSASSSEQLDSDSLGPRKRRRSGSLTRVFNSGLNNIKRIVGAKSSTRSDGPSAGTAVTPCIKSATKRKILQPLPAFSDKKKRDVLKSLPNSTSSASRHLGFGDPELYSLTPRVCNHPNPRKTKTPPSKAEHRFIPKTRLGITSRLSLKKQKRSDQVRPEDGGNSEEPPMMTRGWSFFGRKNHPVDSVSHPSFIEDEESSVDSDLNPSFIGVNLSQTESSTSKDFVTIPKSEFESIKKRLSNIEDKMIEYDNMTPDPSDPLIVQTVYEKTLEKSSTFDDDSTDQLAKRISRGLKIRFSNESQRFRSPSARRIGSVRRRSQDSNRKARNAAIVRSKSCSDRPLKRGQPNTIMTGLPQPSASVFKPGALEDTSRTQLIYQPSIYGPVTRSQTQCSSSFHGTTSSPANIVKIASQGHIVIDHEDWQDAHKIFGKKQSPCNVSSTRRDSVAKIFSQNAGLVLQRTKQFDCDRSETADHLHCSFDKLKAGDRPLNRTKSLFGLNHELAPKRVAQLFLEDSSHAQSPVLLAQSFASQKSYLHSVKNSPKKIGSPRKQPDRQKATVPYYHIQSSKSPKSKTIKSESISHASVNMSSNDFDKSKENIVKPLICSLGTVTSMHMPQHKQVVFSPQIDLPDNLRETIYSVCTPTADKMKLKIPVSPLKDCNRSLPYIKQPLMPRTPLPFARTPQPMSIERKRIATPMKALVAADSTPLGSPRRASPRLQILKARALQASGGLATKSFGSVS